MVRREVKEERPHMRGGEGTVEVYHILTKEEMMGHGRLYARIVLPPGASIGVHEHIHETEPYYIVSGHGIFIDENNDEVPVEPGDVCLLTVGKTHGIANRSDEDLVMMALIYYDGTRFEK